MVSDSVTRPPIPISQAALDEVIRRHALFQAGRHGGQRAMARLDGAEQHQADPCGADVRRANFSGADLSLANVAAAPVEQADSTNTRLSDMIGMKS